VGADRPRAGLERTRSLSLRDSIVAIRGVGKRVVSAGRSGESVLPRDRPAAAFLAVPNGVNVSSAVAVAGVILALALNVGLRGEAALRRAAEGWRRLRTCPPRMHDWQTNGLAPLRASSDRRAAALYLLASAIVLRGSDAWEFNVWIANAVAAETG
jgi:hypothetical protein